MWHDDWPCDCLKWQKIDKNLKTRSSLQVALDNISQEGGQLAIFTEFEQIPRPFKSFVIRGRKATYFKPVPLENGDSRELTFVNPPGKNGQKEVLRHGDRLPIQTRRQTAG